MGTSADSHSSLELQPPSPEGVVLLEELLHVQDHAVAQQAALPVVQDPRRDLVQNELFLTHVHGVPRVGPTLIAGHDVGVLGQDVDDLPLPLVTPLTADDDRAIPRSGHGSPGREKRALPAGGWALMTAVSFGKS